MKIRVRLEQTGVTAVGFPVSEADVLALGKGKRPPVRVTINGYTYRSTIAPMGGRYLIGVSAENRAGAGVAGGQEVDVELELDAAPREVALPPDFAAALAADPAAATTFDRLSPSNKGYQVTLIEGAKTADTRQRRIDKAIAVLHDGKPR